MSIPRLIFANTYSRPPQLDSRDKALDREDGSQFLALAANRSFALLQESAASVLPITTILVSILLRNNLDARNDAIVIRGVHDMATDTSAETKNMEGKLDALVNLVTQLAANQKPAFVARVCGIRSSNDHYTSVCPSSQ
ncbi:hypothetical protein Fmac_028558 [Flemingia macrophylla]|uniref:Uncharacterized protein n=1 Tax=Flemingia macrophylla TaxID=520843 RepID=A0ABD1L7U0_9FABA